MLSPSMLALMIGHCCRAMTAARTKNGMNVRRAPWRCSNPDLSLLRRFTMRVRSTSYMQWTCALVRRDSIMWLGISLRMFYMGTRTPGYGAGVAGRGGAGAAGADSRALPFASLRVCGTAEAAVPTRPGVDP